MTQSRRHERARPKFYASTLSLSQFGTNAIFSLVPFGDDKSDLDKKKNVAIDSNSSVLLQMPRLHKKKKLLICFNFNVRLTNIIFVNLFYYLIYFCYYLWVLLHFLVLFMSLTILFHLSFTFIYGTFNKKFSVSAK